jgi:serpin B
MKKTILIAIAFIMAFSSCKKEPTPTDNPRTDIKLTRTEKQLVSENNDFAFNLFRTAQSNGSQILSPLSITYALGMLNNGATGQTQQEINTVLGFGDTGADAINDFCKKMLAEVPSLDKMTKVMIANTIFVNSGQGYELKPPFMEKANNYYNADPESRDFKDGRTLDVINQWASDHTEKMITKVLNEDEFNPEAVSYLLNAIYFKGEWSMKFKKNETKDEPFNNGEKVPMMHQECELSYTDNDTYQSLNLPYGNGAYCMTVMLPHEGKTTDDILNQLNGQSWNDNFYQMSTYNVDVKLPRFETNTNLNLVEIMSRLGMPTAFDPNTAQFDEFCNVPTYIALMKQVAKIKLDEEGTEAAAVTVVGMFETAAEEEPEPPYAVFHADHSFLYVISEQSTGAIFFIGKYTGN